MDKKPAYKRCPRCELNFIKSDEEYCSVCQEELNARRERDMLGLGMEICPVCKANYISENEIMCSSCLAEKGEDFDEEDWDEYIDEEEDELSNEDEEIGSMSSISEHDDMPNGIDLGLDLDDEMSFDDLDDVAKDGFGDAFDDEEFDDDEDEEEDFGDVDDADDDFEDTDDDEDDLDDEEDDK